MGAQAFDRWSQALRRAPMTGWEAMAMLNLVTGATGMVGGHLVEALVLRGERVRAFVRPTSRVERLRALGVEIRIGQLTDQASLMAAAQGVDRVFHCAALVSDWGLVEHFQQVNVHGTRNVLAAATRARVSRFVFLSSTDVYGFPGRPVVETERPSPRGFAFADSKIEAEALVWNHHRRVGLPTCILRCGLVYGPGSRFILTLLVEPMRRRRLVLIDDGCHPAGLTYVGNLVDAFILAANCEAGIGQAYNITDGSQVTWRAFVDALADLLQMPRPTRRQSHRRAYALAAAWEYAYRLMGRAQRPPLTRALVERMGTAHEYPITKAVSQLGYRPRVGFTEGIRHVGDWLLQEGLLEDTPAVRVLD
jgi:nucleoside-diphosphate-sugar epimerase